MENTTRSNNSNISYADQGCRGCMNFYDGKYCKKWRDIVPKDVVSEGCDAVDQFPPFPED
jgi:hypothetical protein